MSKSVQSPNLSDDPPRPQLSNTVALIGVILAVVGAVFCSILFLLAHQLPDDIEAFSTRNANSSAHLRLLILGCSTAVLLLVSLILSIVGLFLPNRSRQLAIVGTVASLILFLGIFGVLMAAVLFTPDVQTTFRTQPLSFSIGCYWFT
jgi:drug/metabolite transporter (DMT)-like permease